MIVVTLKLPIVRARFVALAALLGGLAAAASVLAAAGLHVVLAVAPIEVRITSRPGTTPARRFELGGNPTAVRFFGTHRAAVLEAGAVGFVDLETGEATHFEPDMLGEIRAMDVVGERIALADANGGVGVYEHGVWKFLEADGPVRSVALSPDGRWLVAATERDRVNCWRIENFEHPCEPVVRRVRGVSRLVFVSPGTLFVAVDVTDSEVWDLEAGATRGSLDSAGTINVLKELWRAFGAPAIVSPLRLTSGGAQLWAEGLTGSQVHVWNLDSGLDVVPTRDLRDVRSLDISLDGKRLLVARRGPTSLQLWDLTSRERIPIPR